MKTLRLSSALVAATASVSFAGNEIFIDQTAPASDSETIEPSRDDYDECYEDKLMLLEKYPGIQNQHITVRTSPSAKACHRATS